MRADHKTIEKGISSVELMKRVAKGVLDNISLKEGKTLILSGKGGNGGDGYALFLFMRERGLPVDLVDFGESKHEGALSLRKECGEIIPYSDDLDFTLYANILDCIFGVGLTRKPEGQYASAIRKINRSGAYVVSLDIPSGLTADGGIALGEAVKAEVTIAVERIKLGHFLSDGLDLCGDVGALPIGLEEEKADAALVEESDVIPLFPPLKRNLHKGSLGRLSVIAGSESYSGAAVLAELGAAAFALGDGLVKLCVPDSILYPVMHKITECTLLSMPSKEGKIAFEPSYLDKAIGGANALLFGNGADISEDGYQILEYLILKAEVPLILDADALNLLAASPELLKNRPAQTVITPHPREMSRLMGLPTEEILSDPLSYAEEFARRYQVIVVLKGASTVITDGVKSYLSATGSSGMAKGGSGDLLAGAVAALCAGGRDPLTASYGAAYILGAAGELASAEKGAYSALPTDTYRHIAAIVKRLSDQAQKK